MKNNTSNPVRRIINDAVKAVRNDRSRSPQAQRGTAIEFYQTAPARDESDNVTGTIHVAMTELDSTETGAVTGGW